MIRHLDRTRTAFGIATIVTNNGECNSAPGQTQTFCWAAGLPPGVTVARVGDSTEGVDGNAPAKLFWAVQ